MGVAIDRQTHDSDVIERVLGLDEHKDEDDVRTEVIDLAVQPRLADLMVSAVQLTIGAIRPRYAPQRRR
jgi:hypothetical protein